MPGNSTRDIVLTRFPNLYSDAVESLSIRSSKRSSLTLPIDGEATIIHSWAFLLKCYTGDDELRFMVNDSIVTVQLSTWTVQRSQYVEDISVSPDGTGILTRVLPKKLYIREINAYVYSTGLWKR